MLFFYISQYFISLQCCFNFLSRLKKNLCLQKPHIRLWLYSRDKRSNCTKLALGRLAQNWVHNQSFAFWMQYQFLSNSTVPLSSRSAAQPLRGSAVSARPAVPLLNRLLSSAFVLSDHASAERVGVRQLTYVANTHAQHGASYWSTQTRASPPANRKAEGESFKTKRYIHKKINYRRSLLFLFT